MITKDSKTNSSDEPNMIALCREDWSSLLQFDLMDLQHKTQMKQEMFGLPCQKIMHQKLPTQQLKNILERCFYEISNIDPTDHEEFCNRSLPRFRAFISRNLLDHGFQPTEVDETTLLSQLVGGMLDLKNSSQETLEKNITLADRLIDKNPDLYLAYKAKLIMFVIKETKYGGSVDEAEYQRLYDELLSFEGISKTSKLTEEADVLATEKISDQETAEVTSTEIEPPLTDGNELSNSHDLFEIDEDLIHIPFMRLSALGHIEDLNRMAEDFIGAFPQSPIGYYYLAESLWRNNQHSEALVTMREASLLQNDDLFIRQLALMEQSNDPTQTFPSMINFDIENFYQNE